eukprot:gene1037-821_t
MRGCLQEFFEMNPDVRTASIATGLDSRRRCMVCAERADPDFVPGHGHAGQSYRNDRDLQDVFRFSNDVYQTKVMGTRPSTGYSTVSPRPHTGRSTASPRPMTGYSEVSSGYNRVAPAQMESSDFPSRRTPRTNSPRKRDKDSLSNVGRQVVKRDTKLLAAGSSLTPRVSPDSWNDSDRRRHDNVEQARAVMRAWHAGDPALVLAGQHKSI